MYLWDGIYWGKARQTQAVPYWLLTAASITAGGCQGHVCFFVALGSSNTRSVSLGRNLLGKSTSNASRPLLAAHCRLDHSSDAVDWQGHVCFFVALGSSNTLVYLWDGIYWGKARQMQAVPCWLLTAASITAGGCQGHVCFFVALGSSNTLVYLWDGIYWGKARQMQAVPCWLLTAASITARMLAAVKGMFVSSLL